MAHRPRYSNKVIRVQRNEFSGKIAQEPQDVSSRQHTKLKMELNSSQFDTIRERFIELNRQRTERSQQDLRPHQRDFLSMLPFLFHVNHVAMPGYVGPDVVYGVSAYAFEDSVLNTAKRLWKGFDIQKRAQWSYAIEAIFLMGSAGTIAFSTKSDFDIWLCYKPGLSAKQLEDLQKKCTGIERWADELGLEAHFFLMDAEDFRQGKIGDLSSESSGSAQHRLLLDEFYRTSIWVAGKHPFWWFVPPERELEYEEIKAYVEDKRLLDADECIDFGSLPTIPPEEFLGAAVWQLYKGVDSPFKSLLKITLMEAYADQFPQGIPLSTDFKQKIYDGETNLDVLDPYIMLLSRLEDYVRGLSDKLRMETVRRSFYLKIGIALTSESAKLKKTWRHELLRKMVDEWGWSQKQLEHHDAYSAWKIDDVLLESKLVVDHLSKCYMFLSNFARAHGGEAMINQKDLTILGRKLYAVFEKKPGKVELVSHGISSLIHEDVITVFQAYDKDRNDRWMLYRGKVTKADFKNHKPLHRADSLIELMAWAYFNRAVGLLTQKLLYAPGTDMKNSELHTLLETMQKLCADPSHFTPGSDDLKYGAAIESVFAYVNVGKVPKIIGSKMDKEIISGALDVLKFGNLEESLFMSMEMIYTTTWKEVYVQKYKGMTGVMQWLCAFLSFSLKKDGSAMSRLLPVPEVHSFSSHFGHLLTRRLSEIAQKACTFFYEQKNLPGGSVVIEAVRNYFVITRKGSKFVSQRFDSLNKLMAYLAMPKENFHAVYFDDASLRKSVIPKMYSENKAGVLQLFYERHSEYIMIYVLDEFGALFSQRLADTDVSSVLSHYYSFFKNSLLGYRFAKLEDAEREKQFALQEMQLIEFYVIKRTGFDYFTEEVKLNDVKHTRRPYHLLAQGKVVDGRTSFNFICEKGSFSSGKYGAKVFSVVSEHLKSFRSTQENYPVYITAVELAPGLIKTKIGDYPQGQYLLSYKKRIEEKLNSAE